jgi:hypothetical protein
MLLEAWQEYLLYIDSGLRCVSLLVCLFSLSPDASRRSVEMESTWQCHMVYLLNGVCYYIINPASSWSAFISSTIVSLRCLDSIYCFCILCSWINHFDRYQFNIHGQIFFFYSCNKYGTNSTKWLISWLMSKDYRHCIPDSPMGERHFRSFPLKFQLPLYDSESVQSLKCFFFLFF